MTMRQDVPAEIRRKLDVQCFETARRLASAALSTLAEDGDDRDFRLLLHEALSGLGEIDAAQRVLALVEGRDTEEQVRVMLLRAEDYHKLTASDFYRVSEERRQGLSCDEYAERYEALADAEFDRAIALCTSPERRRLVAKSLRRAGRDRRAETLEASDPPAMAARSQGAPGGSGPVPETPAPAGVGSLHGVLRLADGTPVRHATVTLGLPCRVFHANPRGYLGRGIDGGIHARFPEAQQICTAETDATGSYRFDALPAATYAFLSVTLDPAVYDVALRFFARDIIIQPDAVTCCDGRIGDWVSAAAKAVENPFPDVRMHRGATLRCLSTWTVRNPFHFEFPRQFVTLPQVGSCGAAPLVLFSSHDADTPIPVQTLADGALGCFLDLPERTDRVLALYEGEVGSGAGLASGESSPMVSSPDADGRTAVIDTGRALFRIPAGEGADAVAPILSVCGESGLWRGNGRLVLPEGMAVVRRVTRIVEQGPLQSCVEVSYALSDGSALRFALTAHRGEAYLLVRETTAPVEGLVFEFSLKEFQGGRGFLHWTPEHGSQHWTTLRACNTELARLQESVAWWIPPQGFGYAMTPDGLDETDYIGVFTRCRGEWIDRAFEAIAQGPGDDNRELDWPYPEMVGATISMITAHTTDDGDACFRFGGFDGERQWGLLVSTLERNDGPYKELSSVQHKVSSPRLQDFMTWRLHDQDALQRPFLIVKRDELATLRRKRRHPALAPVWEKVVNSHDRGPARGLRALVESDAALAWRLACEMKVEAPLRARMTLLGRDYSDVYSPVGGRGITPFAEQYDLIAATGVFTAEEERDVRAMLLLMGHLYMEADLMNWRFNSRNANFEADRTDIVGAIGLAFRGNPDADAMVHHVTELMERSLEVYCTPGSGKWYENPACYYIHASTCRLNLAFHLWHHRILDVAGIKRLKDFLSWGPLLLTARYPHDYALLRDGCTYEDYEHAAKVRRIPPIGDHAKVGQWVSEYFALMGKVCQAGDPAFADFLRSAYQEGGSDGGHFSNFPLFFTAMEADDLLPAPARYLESRRLEGFGAVFRGAFGTADEFYLLFKQGPGGYRYHRTEGSFLLMAHGRPLVWDGGEAGETWRHSTLSFHGTHMPLAPGHVEQFHSLASVDFVQGVHPKALDPGEPVFLSDVCEHTLVPVAFERYHEPDPADVRTVMWVKDEYVVVSDDLHLAPGIRTHWHLQVVADTHAGTVADPDGIRFTGRFGVDLQLLMPGLPADAEAKVVQVPTLEYRTEPSQCFAMRHLQLGMQSPARLDAVLRPLAPGQKPLRAEAFDGGIRVRGEGIDDTLFVSREGRAIERDGIRFSGRYGAVLRRPGRTTLVLLDGRCIASGGRELSEVGELGG